MYKIKPKKWISYLIPQNQRELRSQHIPFFYFYKDHFKPYFVVSLFLLVSLFISFNARVGIVITVTMLIYLSVLYLKTQTVAQNLILKRKLKSNELIEGHDIEIEYEIKNESSFSVDFLYLRDYIGAAQESLLEHKLEPCLDSGNRLFVKKKKCCDGGMGYYDIGPVSILITDLFGIFEFNIEVELKERVCVFPSVLPIDEIHLKGHSLSQDFGLQETSKSGESVIFSGLRTYNFSDNVRHIAWKASAKSPELLVKEFERTVNTPVSVYCNFDPQIHYGIGAISTMEYTADIALSLLEKEVQSGSQIQFICDEIYVPFSQGNDVFQMISHELMKRKHKYTKELETQVLNFSKKDSQELLDFEKETPSQDYIMKTIISKIPSFSSFVYISPYDEKSIKAHQIYFEYLLSKSVDVVCVFLNENHILKNMQSHLKSSVYLLKERIFNNSVILNLRKKGVLCYMAQVEVQKQNSPKKHGEEKSIFQPKKIKIERAMI